MKVTRRSPLTGIEHVMDLDVTEEQLAEMDKPPQQRRLVQDIFPHLTNAEREFIKTGYTEDDWAEMFPPEED